MSIEDEIFDTAINVQGIKRTKSMYEKARYLHNCSMCLDESKKEVAYRLKIEYVRDYATPYIFICDECYNELPDD